MFLRRLLIAATAITFVMPALAQYTPTPAPSVMPPAAFAERQLVGERGLLMPRSCSTLGADMKAGCFAAQAQLEAATAPK